MRSPEWIAILYFAYFGVAGAIGRRRRPTLRLAVAAASALTIAAIVIVARAGVAIVRDWMPLASIGIAYFAGGLVFDAPSPRFECWLARWDRRVLGDPATRFAGWPRLAIRYLEIVYAGCFLLLPAGFLVLTVVGAGALADHYWSVVQLAEFGAFAPLAFVQSRPPWALERPPVLRDEAAHRAGVAFVRRFTIGANTFPSGHVAGSLAVAFGVMGPAPLAGAIFLALAVSIVIACVVGRYHYVADVVAGAALGIGAWLAVILLSSVR